MKNLYEREKSDIFTDARTSVPLMTLLQLSQFQTLSLAFHFQTMSISSFLNEEEQASTSLQKIDKIWVFYVLSITASDSSWKEEIF
jgi:hypothetical protein